MQLNLILHVHLTSGFKCRNFLIGIQPHHTTPVPPPPSLYSCASRGIARMFYCLKVCLNYVRARLEQPLPPCQSEPAQILSCFEECVECECECEYRTFLSAYRSFSSVSLLAKATYNQTTLPRPIQFVIGNFLIKSFIQVMGYLH